MKSEENDMEVTHSLEVEMIVTEEITPIGTPVFKSCKRKCREEGSCSCPESLGSSLAAPHTTLHT